MTNVPSVPHHLLNLPILFSISTSHRHPSCNQSMASHHPKQSNPSTKSHPPTPSTSPKKKLFGFLPLVDLGCGRFSSSTVSVQQERTRRRNNNNNNNKNNKKKKRKQRKQGRNRGPCSEHVCCAPPGVGFTYDVAQSTSADPDRRNRRQRSRASRQAMDRQRSTNAAQSEGSDFVRSNVSDSRQYNRPARRSPGGISEIVMIEHNPLLDGRIEGSDRYGAWRINADIMSYEELVELSDRIGYVDGGLQEEEILECIKRPKKSFIKSVDFNSKVKDSKCSICQEECKGDEELGRLECGHYHHLDCIKQWLLRKNECPICKTVAKPDK